MPEELNFFIEEDLCSERIDTCIALLHDSITRSHAQKLLREGNVRLNGECVRQKSAHLKTGDRLTVLLPEPEPLEIVPADIPIDIVYEDSSVLIVNKPKGMVVHPAPGHFDDTLVNALLWHCPHLSGINGVSRPGIVHRIDRDTTGLLVICKTDDAHVKLSTQLASHSITRRYYAIACGKITEDGTVDAPIGRHPADRKKMAVNVPNGRRAVTHYHAIENLSGGKYTYLECRLRTGRTHQIRVHMASIHHPLLGDTVYGSPKQPYHTEGQVLHAGVLGFIHPETGEYVEFEAPLPDYFKELLEKLR